MIYNAFRKLLAKYCQALPQEDSSLIYEISSLQYEKSQEKNRPQMRPISIFAVCCKPMKTITTVLSGKLKLL
ncbi:hypothetical protein [Endozoicomonas sp. SCSIO W0465]|uniref:hypothetical protein n=1 Tax=Endozoicomonas sp. SCSIO W0465 TaxID=2918516 RepID=UPI00207513E3|nr:hypothetical protein [Endozoicomonas sp. SCSIO W0465]USE37325.1 hypothetical protein MJO57_03605 [Endozoicomonas sp. SCSIO W0465]